MNLTEIWNQIELNWVKYLTEASDFLLLLNTIHDRSLPKACLKDIFKE